MKNIIAIMFLAIISGCASSTASYDKDAVVYTGDFGGSPIELSLVKLDDSSVKGRSSHLGQISEMSGKRTYSEKGYIYHLKEIGTSRFEGVFDFELDTALNLIFGSWQLADTSGKHQAILYTLQPKLAK